MYTKILQDPDGCRSCSQNESSEEQKHLRTAQGSNTLVLCIEISWNAYRFGGFDFNACHAWQPLKNTNTQNHLSITFVIIYRFINPRNLGAKSWMIKALVPKQMKFSESILYMFSSSVNGLGWGLPSLDLLRFKDVRQQSICRIWDSDHLIWKQVLRFEILRQDWNQQMQFTKPFHASLYITPIWVIQGTSLNSLVSLHAQEACLACWLFLLFAYNLLQPSIDSGAFCQKLQKSLAKVNTQATSEHQVWQSQAPPSPSRAALGHYSLLHRKSRNQLPRTVMRKWLHIISLQKFHVTFISTRSGRTVATLHPSIQLKIESRLVGSNIDSFLKAISLRKGHYSVTQSQGLSKFGRILFPGVLNGNWTHLIPSWRIGDTYNRIHLGHCCLST